MSELIFGLGMPKTGTVSLALALEILGYRVLHDFKEMEKLSTNLSNGFTYDPLFDKYNAFLDFPHPAKALSSVWAIPETKIIYTLRDDNLEWINSCLVHVLHSRVSGDNNWIEINVRSLLDEKVDLDLRISLLPTERCLKLDVPSGWKPLCDFLNKPIPNVDFPHENGSIEKLEKVLTIYKGKSSVRNQPVSPTSTGNSPRV